MNGNAVSGEIRFLLDSSVFIRMAPELQTVIEETPHYEVTTMNKLNEKENTVLLNLASHKLVTWTFVKLSVAYKYIGLFV